MLLRRARATRLASIYLLFTVALLMVPKADVPETSFDEANTPTNEMVVVKADSSIEHRKLDYRAGANDVCAVAVRSGVRRISPVFAGQLD